MVSFIIKKLPILKILKVVTRRFLSVWVEPLQRILCYSKDVWAVETAGINYQLIKK